jgi:hypothetical protein
MIVLMSTRPAARAATDSGGMLGAGRGAGFVVVAAADVIGAGGDVVVETGLLSADEMVAGTRETGGSEAERGPPELWVQPAIAAATATPTSQTRPCPTGSILPRAR